MRLCIMRLCIMRLCIMYYENVLCIMRMYYVLCILCIMRLCIINYIKNDNMYII